MVDLVVPLEILLDPFTILKEAFGRVAKDCIKSPGGKNFREAFWPVEHGESVTVQGRTEHPGLIMDDLRADECITAPDCMPEILEYLF
jgi:hypothetical protein